MLGLVIHAWLSQRMGFTEGTIIAFWGLTWSFPLPIRIGDTIHVVQRVKELKETSNPERGVMTFEKEVVNQKGEVVQKGTTTILMARKKRDQ